MTKKNVFRASHHDIHSTMKKFAAQLLNAHSSSPSNSPNSDLAASDHQDSIAKAESFVDRFLILEPDEFAEQVETEGLTSLDLYYVLGKAMARAESTHQAALADKKWDIRYGATFRSILEAWQQNLRAQHPITKQVFAQDWEYKLEDTEHAVTYEKILNYLDGR